MAKFRTVKVEVPDISTLAIQGQGLDPDKVNHLNRLCATYRQLKDAIAPLEEQIKPYEKARRQVSEEIKPLAEALALPNRVLAADAGWDLRKTTRPGGLNVDKLTMTLLKAGWTMDQVKWLIESATDPGSESWAVYALKTDDGDGD